jgi:prepilin signal peptidase PulO-like enzyme (type II secretory pathway)
MSLIIFKIFVASIFGLLLGNYATTVYHRIPRGKPINGLSQKFGLKPHCSSCNHELKIYEYFPLLSWFSTGFKCNYCGAKTDWVYTFLEVSGFLIAIFFLLILDLSYSYIIITCLWIIYLLILVLFTNYKKLWYRVIFTWIMIYMLLLGLINNPNGWM